ncbi:sce7726 family protein [Microbacterium sp. NIBRBAC000506063]|uniref:sce7726 family protein n=1 Tax=Microbacterium sp. NIBRBAC000506063 TaxID=2734618 RepID=UPI001BB51021|nr:sce7726 family protein [Microbacterium sp. NIBRBAC000506063]QTV78979.1 sce7726 family protein [Microbacterium sp. NIBRBAC000506063]
MRATQAQRVGHHDRLHEAGVGSPVPDLFALRSARTWQGGPISIVGALAHGDAHPEELPSNASLADVFELAFSTLRQLGNRDDYVYRSAVTQKIVLGKHNLRTTTVLNELRAGSSKADVVVLNGTSTAYEIKSERDSFQRLPSQLADYRSVFASVNIVTSPAQADEVLRLAPDDVGVLVLSSRFRVQSVREAVNLPERTRSLSILATLRVDEAIRVLQALNVPFPDVPNTRRWSELRAVFAELRSVDVHAKAVTVLKSSRSRAGLEPFIKQLPKPLSAAILSADLSSSAQKNLQSATWQTLSTVLAWS